VDEDSNDGMTQIFADYSDPANNKVDLAINDPADLKRFLGVLGCWVDHYNG
jgi:hypothetical protein